jgi:hypothetical protein
LSAVPSVGRPEKILAAWGEVDTLRGKETPRGGAVTTSGRPNTKARRGVLTTEYTEYTEKGNWGRYENPRGLAGNQHFQPQMDGEVCYRKERKERKERRTDF